jgi:hypothetical protein
VERALHNEQGLSPRHKIQRCAHPRILNRRPIAHLIPREMELPRARSEEALPDAVAEVAFDLVDQHRDILRVRGRQEPAPGRKHDMREAG